MIAAALLLFSAQDTSAQACEAVEQRYQSDREWIAKRIKEIEAEEKADTAAHKPQLARNTKFSEFKDQVERVEARYELGSRDCSKGGAK